jgi:APA family basic amino acid/polyamine antiporter
MPHDQPSDGKPSLVRQLGLFDSTMIMLGIIIGSGIFVTTGLMARSLPSPGLVLLAWVVGGLITLLGALTYAELGAAMPEAGGQYVYMREAYGPLSGFLYGWVLFAVYMTGGIAALGAAFAEYLGYFFPALGTGNFLLRIDLGFLLRGREYALSAGQIVGVVAIILLSILNYFGLALGKIVQNSLTVLKIGILVAFIVIGFAVGKGQPFDLDFTPAGFGLGRLMIGFGVALVAVSWAFDGWNNVIFVAGEVKKPHRNVPASLVLGTLIATVLYALVNYLYFWALPVEQVVGVVRIAEKASTALFGGPAAAVVSAAVVVSSFGAMNGSIIVGPRVYYAMARDNLFFKRMAEVHPRFRTPGFAILIQAVWSSLIALSGTFEQIITFAMFVSIMFWIAAAASVFTLRKKRPDMPRPYKTWGYPVVPLIFILASAGILFDTLIEKPIESLAGIALTLVGIPLYFYWKHKSVSERS